SPRGCRLFCFIATLLVGRVRFEVPVLFTLGGLAVFVMGGLTGVMVALVPFDLQAHDTYFVVAHLHAVLIGGTIFPVVGAFHYFFPLATGKHLSKRLGVITFWLMFVGFNITFLPMHVTGLWGMPRRVFTYPAGIGFDTLNLVSTLGSYILGAGMLVFMLDVFRPKGRQPLSKRNPWNAGTLEWLAEIPGRPWGVRSIPEIDGRYPLWDQPNFVRDVDEGRFYLSDAPERKRETLATSAIDAKPTQCFRVPGPTFITLWAALFTGGAFIFSTFHLWWLGGASAALAMLAILRWLWTGTALIPERETKDVGLGLELPLYVSGPSSPGWWGMFITMLGDMTAFVSLVFGYFFYWTVHDDFPPVEIPGPGLFYPAVALGLVVLAWGLVRFARSMNRRDSTAGTLFGLMASTSSSVFGAFALLLGPWTHGMDPKVHVYPAIVWVIVGWTVLHLALGALMNAYCSARRLAKRMTARHDIDIVNIELYWHFALLTTIIAVAVIAGFPELSRP
ncbi:MAG: cytochrome ubiquinol oxidase subunit I, partial [Myxococcales bacterium]|nr:cytochrome ubiquinol oxidase subunit I [Myxococcales bacterium]